nr:interleukin-22 receptor subunit alpha-2-like [Pelodiscus sinensis]|eukprot:XP_025040071.1 interleukin-22 receptor subunit alpha-2-like [Pelodiscus sinensis]
MNCQSGRERGARLLGAQVGAAGVGETHEPEERLPSGMLSPPQNVMLTSENFHTLLAWEPGASSGNGTRYEVESRQRSSDWTKVDPCWRDGPGAAPTCRLYFEDMHNMYWARVRATDGARVSAILGPPNLTLTLANENLTVNLSMPLTPYRRRNGTYKSVQKVLPNWMYRLSLSEEGVPINSRFWVPLT